MDRNVKRMGGGRWGAAAGRETKLSATEGQGARAGSWASPWSSRERKNVRRLGSSLWQQCAGEQGAGGGGAGLSRESEAPAPDDQGTGSSCVCQA